MQALAWIRTKAAVTAVEEFPGNAGETFKVTRSVYRGTLPYRMAKELRSQLADLVKSDMEVETLLIGGQYRGDFGRCEYIHAVYERVA